DSISAARFIFRIRPTAAMVPTSVNLCLDPGQSFGGAMRRDRVVVFTVVLCLAAACGGYAQTATPEEVQNPLLVLRNLPHAPSHDRIHVRRYDFKELGGP